MVEKRKQWELLWVDPEPEDDDPRLEFDELQFFRHYYTEILTLLAKSPYRKATVEGVLVTLPLAGISVGLHHDILKALVHPIWHDGLLMPAPLQPLGKLLDIFGEMTDEEWPIWNPNAVPKIKEFAKGRIADSFEHIPEEKAAKDGVIAIFADGILIESYRRRRYRRQPYDIPFTPRTSSKITNFMKAKSNSTSRQVGHSERDTQNRVIALFRDELGYRYLGDRSDTANNSNIEEDLLSAHLIQAGYTMAQIGRAIHLLRVEAENPNRSLYDNNKAVYSMLRYGVPVKIEAGKVTETVKLIDWETPEANDFTIVEEVTLRGNLERRPDLVLYINGIGVVVIELKNSHVSIGEGIRQLLSNQKSEFNEWFFTTVQIVIAGNDTEGLKYGTILTPEKMFLRWKEDEADDSRYKLDKYLLKMCSKDRLIELLHDFVLFDGGIKKLPRVHQYFGIKEAQKKILQYIGGIIWHTQGSGKSILMVLLAKWVLENDPDARILVVTDRDELDKQIVGVMKNAGVIANDAPLPRITSRKEMVEKLAAATPRLMCALIHKIDASDLEGEPPKVTGRFYVFVDECHRTQGGDMNRQMKRWLSSAIFVGFTGTPLLRKDKQMTEHVFGTFIHTYKFHEAVADKVVLDLKYEARTVPQRLTSRQAIDDWFEQKTKGLNTYQKSVLRRRWATMEELMSAGERKQRIIADINHDFGVKPRLNSDRGTAILVAASIYDACHYFQLFQPTPLGPYCGIITSFEPNQGAIATAPANSDERYKYDTYTQFVLKDFPTTEKYESEMKRRFIEEPANLKLLIVVSKLLTGFDAPSCTYIYLDNELRDHNLFQAICRTNRLDGDDKDYGHIVDYKELFANVQHAISVYTSDELAPDAQGDTGNVELKNWLIEGKKKLDEARDALRHLCEPVPPPRELEQYLGYFCGQAANPQALNDTEPLRIAFYKAVATFVRAYADLAQNLVEAGYSAAEAKSLADESAFFTEMRAAVKKHSGEELDIKPYEADMRHLINTYIQADSATPLGDLDALPLTELIVETGINDAIARKLNEKGKLSKKAIAEGIINNIRKTIIRDQLTDPRFYEQMSQLLDDLIKQYRDETAAYQQFLRNAEALARQLIHGRPTGDVPAELHGNKEAIVLYSNLDSILGEQTAGAAAIGEDTAERKQERAHLALEIDRAMREHAPAGWKGDPAREAQVLNALFPLMSRDREATKALFELIKNQPGY